MIPCGTSALLTVSHVDVRYTVADVEPDLEEDKEKPSAELDMTRRLCAYGRRSDIISTE